VDLGRIVAAILTAMIVAAALWGRLVYLAAPFAGDGGIFAYMGQLTLTGGRFGEEIIDNKFPTVGLVTGVFWAVFGNYWPGYVLTQCAMTFAAGGLLARSAGMTFGPHARFPTFIGVVALMNLNAAVGGGFQLETVFAFFGCVAASCAMLALHRFDRRDALAAGLAAGYAALVKPTGGAAFAAFFICLLLVPRKVPIQSEAPNPPPGTAGRAGLMLAGLIGFAFPMFVALLYLQRSEQLEILPGIARDIRAYASNSTFEYLDLVQPLLLMGFFLGTLFIKLWVYRRPAYRVSSGAGAVLWVFVIAWFAIEVVGIVMQRRMYGYHFIPLTAPAALLFGVLPRKTTMGQIVGPLLLPLFLSTWRASDVLADVTARPMNWANLAAWLEPRTLPGERIWRDNTPQVLINSDLRPASKLQLVFIFKNTDDAPMRFSGVLIDDLRKHNPRYVITQSDLKQFLHIQTTDARELVRIPARRENYVLAWKHIETFLRDRYEPVTVIGNEAIWQRKEATR